MGPITVIAAEPTLSRSSAPATSPASAAEDDKSQLNRTESAPRWKVSAALTVLTLFGVSIIAFRYLTGSLAAACTGACDCSVAT